MLVFFIAQSIYRGWRQSLFSDLEYSIQFMVFFCFQIGGFLVVLLSYKYRKKEEEILEKLSEINELIEKYLNIRSDLNQFKRRAARKIFPQWTITFTSVIFRYFHEKEIYLHESHQLPTPEIAIIVCVMYFSKYIFYVDLLHFQMKVINFTGVIHLEKLGSLIKMKVKTKGLRTEKIVTKCLIPCRFVWSSVGVICPFQST